MTIKRINILIFITSIFATWHLTATEDQALEQTQTEHPTEIPPCLAQQTKQECSLDDEPNGSEVLYDVEATIAEFEARKETKTFEAELGELFQKLRKEHGFYDGKNN